MKKVVITTYSKHITTAFYVFIVLFSLYTCISLIITFTFGGCLTIASQEAWNSEWQVINVQTCVSFVPTFLPFIAACSLQHLALQTFNKKVFFVKKWKRNILEIDEENCRKPAKQQQLCFLMQLHVLGLLINNIIPPQKWS